MSLHSIPCLGLPFRLGQLYDTRAGHIVHGIRSLWEDGVIQDAKNSGTQLESHTQVITSDTVSDKVLALQIDGDFKLSVLVGLIKPSGASKFFENYCASSHQARAVLHYKVTTNVEELSVDKLPVQHSILDKDIATHLVTSVKYGAEAFFVFDSYADSNEACEQLQQQLEGMVTAISKHSSQVTCPVSEDKLNCTVYSDFDINPITYKDVQKVYKELPDIANSVCKPIHVTLYPLNSLHSTLAPTVKINPSVILKLEVVLKDIQSISQQCNDISKQQLTHFPGIQAQLAKFKNIIIQYRSAITAQIAALLPDARKGIISEKEIENILDKIMTAPFSTQNMMKWINGKQQELIKLQSYINSFSKIKGILLV